MSLALRANRLADFQQASIACLPPSLVRLDLSANQISIVDVVALSVFDRLEELDIADNPFDCTGCRLEPFFRWVNTTPRLHLARADRVRCRHEAPSTTSRLSSFSFDSTSLRWSYHCDPSTADNVELGLPDTGVYNSDNVEGSKSDNVELGLPDTGLQRIKRRVRPT